MKLRQEVTGLPGNPREETHLTVSVKVLGPGFALEGPEGLLAADRVLRPAPRPVEGVQDERLGHDLVEVVEAGPDRGDLGGGEGRHQLLGEGRRRGPHASHPRVVVEVEVGEIVVSGESREVLGVGIDVGHPRREPLLPGAPPAEGRSRSHPAGGRPGPRRPRRVRAAPPVCHLRGLGNLEVGHGRPKGCDGGEAIGE